jgi:hypothetical protein
MKRSEFLQTCAAGVCGCGLMALLGPAPTQAGETKDPAPPPADCEAQKRQLDGARERFAILMSIADEELDDATRRRLLRRMGRECAKPWSGYFEKYRGDLPGFLAQAKAAWLESADYDEKTGVLRTVGKPAPCACPLVRAGRTPASFCDCSLGWNQAAFSVVLGKPVDVQLEESVLRGGKRCCFRITIS